MYPRPGHGAVKAVGVQRHVEIGRLIQDRIAPLSPGTSERLVESDNLYELRATHMPSVLPEFGFHDNPEEAQWLIDNMAAIAEETVQAVCEYFDVPYIAPEKQNDLPPEPVELPEVLYRVQVGAFRIRENAEAYLEMVQNAGFPEAFVTEVKN